eukprot:CAMPEP_0114557382 /NCGR_PEP_ID=MMETSP0114-20121206/9802_1 /TAXON_ID=31324 /ORGANISM="Goniomonas sp, Strain m" /LENGTH=246 /DNA_ID=CAMNT_0001742669 /DNA_START=39 /DNA_END=779 /DNA_ORIENTATION=-
MIMDVVTPKVADAKEPRLPQEMSGSVGVILVDAEQGPFHGRVVVLTLVEGGPAEIDGRIHPGDLIVSVDGRVVKDWGLESIRLLVHGRVGTVVLLEFERPSSGTTYCVALTRASQQTAEQHEHELELELKRTRRELHQQAYAHEFADIRADIEERELEKLRKDLAELQREKSDLGASHAHKMFKMRQDHAASLQELEELEDELVFARAELNDERALLEEIEREAQSVKQQLESSRLHPAVLHGVEI